MKICYISNSASPSKNASSLQIAKLCEYISKSGHEVKLILPDTGIKINNKSLPVRKHQPSLGEHSKEILEEIGYNRKEIKKIIDLNKK